MQGFKNIAPRGFLADPDTAFLDSKSVVLYSATGARAGKGDLHVYCTPVLTAGGEEKSVVVKQMNTDLMQNFQQLDNEMAVHALLLTRRECRAIGIVEMMDFGVNGPFTDYYYEYAGPSLSQVPLYAADDNDDSAREVPLSQQAPAEAWHRIQMASRLEAAREDAPQLLKFLHRMQAKGITHRDLKPDKICCKQLEDPAAGTPQRRISVIDCGALHRSTLPQRIDPAYRQQVEDLVGGPAVPCCTPLYTSPERFCALYKLDWPEEAERPLVHDVAAYDTAPAGDVWAAGVTLYHCLTGHHPFEDAMYYGDCVDGAGTNGSDRGSNCKREGSCSEGSSASAEGTGDGSSSAWEVARRGAFEGRALMHPFWPDSLCEMLSGMLARNPDQRWTAAQCLGCAWVHDAARRLHDPAYAAAAAAGDAVRVSALFEREEEAGFEDEASDGCCWVAGSICGGCEEVGSGGSGMLPVDDSSGCEECQEPEGASEEPGDWDEVSEDSGSAGDDEETPAVSADEWQQGPAAEGLQEDSGVASEVEQPENSQQDEVVETSSNGDDQAPPAPETSPSANRAATAVLAAAAINGTVAARAARLVAMLAVALRVAAPQPQSARVGGSSPSHGSAVSVGSAQQLISTTASSSSGDMGSPHGSVCSVGSGSGNEVAAHPLSLRSSPVSSSLTWVNSSQEEEGLRMRCTRGAAIAQGLRKVLLRLSPSDGCGSAKSCREEHSSSRLQVPLAAACDGCAQAPGASAHHGSRSFKLKLPKWCGRVARRQHSSRLAPGGDTSNSGSCSGSKVGVEALEAAAGPKQNENSSNRPPWVARRMSSIKAVWDKRFEKVGSLFLCGRPCVAC